MKTCRGFKKPLLPLLRSTSEPKLSPFGFYKRKKKNVYHDNSSDEDRDAVERLNNWEKKDSKLEVLNSINEATLRLNKRITGQDLVEDLIVRRKHKNKLPLIKSNKIISLAETSKSRQVKKETEQTFKERCRYFRQFEEDLARTHKYLLDNYNKAKWDRDSLREECCEIKRKVTRSIEEFEKTKDELQKIEYKGRLKNKEELQSWLLKKGVTLQRFRIKEQQKAKIAEEVKVELEKRTLDLQELDELCKMLRSKVEIVREAQSKHYMNLLKEGKDTKSEGLQWIVITLWKLGETVSIDSFPPYLDEDSVHCILFISQKSLEADEIIENILNPARRSTVFEKSIDHSIGIKERIQRLTKNLRVERPEYIYDKKTKQVTIKWIPFDESYEENDTDRTATEVQQYESYITKIKEVIKLTKDSEIQRLALECQLHHYEERYKTNIKDLINSIVGAEACEKYLAAIKKEQKKLVEQIESTRTFNFT